ncbi:gamma-glutamyltransferase [Alphaproteobacteria bacterium]|nr:gamma-glutamyltransferase [Alphaproteobacteria bacterium]
MLFFKNFKLIIFIFLLFPLIANSKQKSDINKSEKFNLKNEREILKLKKEGKPVISDKWMVVTANKQASEAAAKILKKGGTATDAMISAQLVLGLVEPESSGLGGGAFLVYYDNEKKEVITLDGRETAPLLVKENMFQDAKGNPLKFFDAVLGGKSVGTPGTPALLEEAYKRWGKTEWSLLFKDAINLSNNGFVISKKLSSSIERSKSSLSSFVNTKSYFLPNDIPLKSGNIHYNKQYTETLKTFAKDGSKVFYQGYIANDIVSTVNNSSFNPGVLSLKDLINYKIIERKPVCSKYRGYKICGMGPPSSGAITIAQILGIIENFDISKLGPKNPETWRLIGDASRLAFADRSLYMADSDFVDVPIKELISKNYLNERAQFLDRKNKIEKIKAGNLISKSSLNWGKDQSIELPSTSHISIIDKYGNALSMTTTIENGFGSRLMTNSGFLLNNQLTDFSFKSFKNGKKIANNIEPGKRPRSSMAPTIILKNNKPVYILGSPGGSNIIGYVVNAIISMIDWKYNAQEAASVAHGINKFGTYYLEKNTIMSKLLPSLEAMNYKVKLRSFSSGLNVVQIDDKLYGGSDHRREGIAISD